jgi:hypothetical protein
MPFLIGSAIAMAPTPSTNDSYDDCNDQKRPHQCHQGLKGPFDKTPGHPYVVSLSIGVQCVRSLVH